MAQQGWRPWRPGGKARLEGLDAVVGHRGAAMHAPENTLVSIRRARELGCRWVELDVKLSRDGVPILMHDEEVRRTTGGSGLVRDLGLDELRRLDAGRWKGEAFAGTPIPTLAEALALLAELDMDLNLEIKPCPGREAETARVACDEIRRLWPAGRRPPLLSSFEIPSLEAARAAAPELPRGYLVERIPPDWRQTMQRLECAALHIGHRHNADWTIRAVAAEGVPLLCYTVNDAERARTLFDLGAAALFSDAPDRIWPVAQ
ncbi:MAG TPA: glycerophosphodiester phosphodiesterase [Geminicoccaceae bacterium]|nr:glycerophosphodiester phosphodiesterase [Geminicoccus sp.]HMU52967.1 glycerophosphodiester phosphodiesterase [Geminicoccaceae bacterium]